MSENQLFSPELRSQLQSVLSKMNREQLLWLGGYIEAAIDFAPLAAQSIAAPSEASSKAVEAVTASPEATRTKRMTVLYGSHSGNSQKVASRMADELSRSGLTTRLVSMEDYNGRQLKEEELLLVVVSTHGDGEPPVVAIELHDLLKGKKAPQLPHLNYAVVALGDSSYKKFCQTGIDFHNYLAKAGAHSLRDVLTLDTDFSESLVSELPVYVQLFQSPAPTGREETTTACGVSGEVGKAGFDVPVSVAVTEKIQLNGRGSDKETWHLEISTEGTDLSYQPGDALEVYAVNNPALVDSIVKKLGLTGEEGVVVDGQQVCLREALTHHYELTVLTLPVLKKYAALNAHAHLSAMLEEPEALDDFLKGSDFLDLITRFPVKISAGGLLGILRKLPPRLYSISSSLAEVGNEVHITVGAVRYEKEDRLREGVCSTFLADRLGDDEHLKVKVRPNPQFRLPANGDVPVVMVGAGTGIAPYRAFVQHRHATGSKGKNWLVFGDQHFTTDFLYQSEWLRYRKAGLLTHVDLAFSRDQAEKVYVQHRLKEQGARLYDWLEGGAHFYVCGDMKRMARDVKTTVLEVLMRHGRKTREEAEAYLAELRKEGRYQEDVY
ncbi:sulfite reductase (NADPH) flavoprotein alpha-component [Breznakibacter xylanolyticus]|uniref:assimilatory sulfite reductase (NADPH) n=1 Tax=Breznakibacter xylanolyticus TaxID=990 RepID=A0A2W7N0X0_9BACT|nr:assimilatory sulfite reductase (NADPH) flavoprotein subunit [Breznakibacter xylanolyticus]PZX10524.1 sulfite reductase (NADPH) flavoprotein alpha-component [Breznakibacter xylanolyticus]